MNVLKMGNLISIFAALKDEQIGIGVLSDLEQFDDRFVCFENDMDCFFRSSLWHLGDYFLLKFVKAGDDKPNSRAYQSGTAFRMSLGMDCDALFSSMVSYVHYALENDDRYDYMSGSHMAKALIEFVGEEPAWHWIIPHDRELVS